ncbi:MAG: serine hydrolase [Pseudomonadota bacterium]
MTGPFSKKQIALGAALLAMAGLAAAGVVADRTVRIAAGYKAKIACSEIFLAGRDADAVSDIEFAGIHPIVEKTSLVIDETGRSAQTSFFGLGRAKAVYRDFTGCTLVNGGRLGPPLAPALTDAADPWPLARAISGEALHHVHYAAVDAAITQAIEDETSGTRAVVVAVDGKIVDERYAEGFSAETPMLGWSMSKSVMATLVGAAVLEGHVDIDDAVSAWPEGDPRAKITWRDLLQMQSGLAFEEDYARSRSTVNRMLFESADAGAVAAREPMTAEPGEVWYYSSGTSNLIARALRNALAAKEIDIYAFAADVLFNPIGASSVVMEPDASGTPVGSSFVYATARDWARLGQLYLQEGVWEGQRILPGGWNDFVAEPAAQSDSQYGAHFWLNRDGGERARFMPALPESMYYMSGHDGQYVVIIPSKRTVIVRLGMTRGRPPLEVARPMIEAIASAIGHVHG